MADMQKQEGVQELKTNSPSESFFSISKVSD